MGYPYFWKHPCTFQNGMYGCTNSYQLSVCFQFADGFGYETSRSVCTQNCCNHSLHRQDIGVLTGENLQQSLEDRFKFIIWRIGGPLLYSLNHNHINHIFFGLVSGKCQPHIGTSSDHNQSVESSTYLDIAAVEVTELQVWCNSTMIFGLWLPNIYIYIHQIYKYTVCGMHFVITSISSEKSLSLTSTELVL